ncbi:hypothetical protein [Pelagibacterium halotolerans]|uniref:hypothetical protein n=1 Tax=Pelagibacterium halotolerans TaxID=531813 RepID=UPI00384E7A95
MATQGDVERLVVQLEARIKDFEKNMAKASGTAAKSYGKMRKDSRTATDRMERDMVTSTGRMNRALAVTSTRVGSFSRSLAPLLGAAVPMLSLAAAMRGAQQALTDLDRIGKQAKSSGLNPETFQEYAYAADLAGVSTDSLSSALDAFNRNAGRAAAGKGELVENLRVLNPELLESIQLARTQEERFRLVADAIKEETDASKQAAIAAAAFGDAGTKMVEMLRHGSAGLDQTAAKARALGIVIDDHLITRAEELNDEFTTATTVLNRQFQQALIALAPFLIQTAQLAANVAMAVRDIGDALQYWSGNLNNISSQNLDQLHRNLGAERGRIEGEILRLESELHRLENSGLSGPSLDMETWNINAALEEHRNRLSEIADEEARINQILLDRPTFSTPGAPDYEGLLDDDEVDTGGGGGNAGADAAIRQAEAVKALIANLKHEQDQLGRTAEEQELYNLLKQVGVDRESEFGQQIEATLGPLQAQRSEIEHNAEMMEELGDIGRSAVDGIIDALADGKIEAEEFGDILSNVLSMAGNFFLNAAFSGIGSSFGLPGFATGTPNTGGARGEPRGVVHGQEAIIPLPNGGKVPVEITAGVAASRALNVNIENYGTSKDFDVQQISHDEVRIIARDEARGAVQEYRSGQLKNDVNRNQRHPRMSIGKG